MRENDLVIWSGDVVTKALSNTVYSWSWHKDGRLVFDRAYEIQCAPEHRDTGIRDLVFSVHGRRFSDLSFLSGTKEENMDKGVMICRHEDGTRFLSTCEDVPTFDSADREWDSECCRAVYADDSGIVLIHCSYGYKVGSIQIYMGLVKSNPAFTALLERLGCADRITPKDLSE